MKRNQLKIMNIVGSLVIVGCVIHMSGIAHKLYTSTTDYLMSSTQVDEEITDTSTVSEEDVVVEDTQIEISKYAGVKFYDVPLSEEIQMHIFYECDGHDIDPAIVIALIERESYYSPNEVSTHGAIGLMQVVPKWHWDRMERLGCTDLYDPYQNITVGIDYLAELKREGGDITYALTAYLYGERKATSLINNNIIPDYTKWVMCRATELQNETYIIN